MILVFCVFYHFLTVTLAKGLLVLLMVSNNQLSVLLISLLFFLFSITLISTTIFIVSFLLFAGKMWIDFKSFLFYSFYYFQLAHKIVHIYEVSCDILTHLYTV
jgi:hypothetical protein